MGPGNFSQTAALPRRLKPFFWDCDFSTLSLAQYRNFIIKRILVEGDWDAIKWLRKTVGDSGIRDWFLSKNGGGLDPRRLRFWGLILDLPKDRVDQWVCGSAKVPLACEGFHVKFHTEVLSDEQRAVLGRLGEFATANGFYLAGGTSVALHLGHRTSVDFDWFSRDSIGDPLVLAERIRTRGLRLEKVRIASGTLHAIVEDVRVSLIDTPIRM